MLYCVTITIPAISVFFFFINERICLGRAAVPGGGRLGVCKLARDRYSPPSFRPNEFVPEE